MLSPRTPSSLVFEPNHWRPTPPFATLYPKRNTWGREEGNPRLSKPSRLEVHTTPQTPVTEVMDGHKGLSAPTMSAKEGVAFRHSDLPSLLDAALSSTHLAICDPFQGTPRSPRRFLTRAFLRRVTTTVSYAPLTKPWELGHVHRKTQTRLPFLPQPRTRNSRTRQPLLGCVRPSLGVRHGHGHPKVSARDPLPAFKRVSVDTYAPSVPIRPNTYDNGLGEFVGMVSMGGGKTILFTSNGHRSPTPSFSMPACSARLLMGNTRYQLPQSIDEVGWDIVNGEENLGTTRQSLVGHHVPPLATSAAPEGTA